MNRKPLKHYYDIIIYRTIANLKRETHRFYLGYFWWLLEPLLNTALFFFIFSVVLSSKTESFITILLTGTIIWQWLDETANTTLTSLESNREIMLDIYLPKYLFPLVDILTGTWKFICVFVILIAYLLLTGHELSVHYIWLPIILAFNFILIAGLSLGLALLVPYFKDIKRIAPLMIRALMFVSGVLFETTRVPESKQTLFFLNPMACYLESYRNILLYQIPPHMEHLLYAGAFSVGICLVTFWMCHKVDLHIGKRLTPA
jgi:lipopolysaccharide transport system permease protein